MNEEQIINSLIEVLLDPKADIGEQDDAAMDLGEYNNDRALAALIQAAQDPATDDWIVLESCGESIAEIWVRKNYFCKKTFNSLRRLARVSIYYYLDSWKSEWIKKYNIKIDP